MIRLTPKSPSKGLKRTPLKRKPFKRKLPKTKTAKPKILKEWARKSALKSMSRKMVKQKRQENKLSLKLAELSGNRCEICGKPADFRGLHKHEIIRRGQQGNELDPLNTLLLGMCCHDHRKYPKSGTPLSIEEQQALAKKLHENIT